MPVWRERDPPPMRSTSEPASENICITIEGKSPAWDGPLRRILRCVSTCM